MFKESFQKMKFWELISAFRSFEKEVELTLFSERWSSPYGEWYKNFDRLVDEQDRQKLGALVPSELVTEVSEAIGDLLVLYLGGGCLRKRPILSSDLKLGAPEVVRRFGGAVIEEVLEYGSCQVKT